MSASHSHGKGKKHKKPKHDEKPSETEKPIEKQVRKLGLEVEILAVIVLIAIIAIVFLLFSENFQIFNENQESGEDLVDDASCTVVNPGMTQQECDDYALKDQAIYGNLPELCDEIKTESIKENCKKFF